MDKYDTNEFVIAIGKRIKQIRDDQDITQLDLAELAGMDMRQVQRIENGEVSTSITNIYLISKALKVSIGDLTNFDESDIQE